MKKDSIFECFYKTKPTSAQGLAFWREVETPLSVKEKASCWWVGQLYSWLWVTLDKCIPLWALTPHCHRSPPREETRGLLVDCSRFPFPRLRCYLCGW